MDHGVILGIFGRRKSTILKVSIIKIYHVAQHFLQLKFLLIVETKLEHVIIQLAHEIAEKHVAVEGELIVTPSDMLAGRHLSIQIDDLVLSICQFKAF
ncbi:MLO-like protein 1 isoform X1 [Capsicum annuum]|uniref:MLO-like protein 1 isoform X1 n=1 Tax=Capsicum annuum TaxID=4072 RepID=UPI0007BF4433|nr:MLO-like protein 1 isoform X1 [Capsicum annuum]